MNRKFKIIYFLGVLFCCVFILFENFILSNYIKVCLTALLFYNFLNNRPNANPKILLLLGLATLCSIFPFVYYENITKSIESYSYLMFIVAHSCYAIIFKTEKASIFANKKIVWGVISMIWIGFFFLMAINNDLIDSVFFTLLLATFVKIIMIWLAFSRKVNSSSYAKGRLAMTMFILSDIAFMVKYWTHFDEVISLVNLFYSLGQYFLFESFILNKSKFTDRLTKYSSHKNILNS